MERWSGPLGFCEMAESYRVLAIILLIEQHACNTSIKMLTFPSDSFSGTPTTCKALKHTVKKVEMVKISILKGVMPTKIFEQYQVNRAKLPFANAVLYVPQHEIRSIMRRAHSTGELTPQMLEKTLIMMIKKRAFDRAQVVLKCWQEDLNLQLSPIHMQMFLNLASQTNHWREALGWWGRVAEDPRSRMHPELYCGVLKAMNQGGLWQQALGLVNEIEEENLHCTAGIRHTLLLALRRNAPWDISMRVVSKLCSHLFMAKPEPQIAVSAAESLANEINCEGIGVLSTQRSVQNHQSLGGEENTHVLTEVLHILHRGLVQSAGARLGSPLASSTAHHQATVIWHRTWRLALGIYHIPAAAQRTTALQNACVEILARSLKWEQAFHFLCANMHRKGAVSSTEDNSCRNHHRVLTPETLAVLLPCLKGSTARLSAVLEFATRHGLPIPSEYVESLFRSIMQPDDCPSTASIKSDRSREVIELFLRFREMALNTTTGSFGYHALCRSLCDALLHCQSGKMAFSVACHFKETLGPVIPALSESLATMGSEHTIYVVEGRIAVIDCSIAQWLTKAQLGKLFDAVFLPYSVTRQQVRFLEAASPRNVKKSLRLKACSFVNAVRRSDLGDQLIRVPYLSQLRAHSHFAGETAQKGASLPDRQHLLHEHKRDDSKTIPIIPQVLVDKSDCAIISSRESSSSGLELQKAPGETIGDRNSRLYAQQNFGVAVMLKRLNFDCDIYFLTRSEAQFSHCEKLCSSYQNGGPKQKSHMPIPVQVSTFEELEMFFSQTNGKLRLPKADADANLTERRTMNPDALKLNL
ncbi:perosamine synthetase [Perkinsela sp. CCAP 1560/4]|nr:perosamine synthetase [Perkinsela sp. CCAP 1560/4]|eukprot:KNH09418.1 perosamine synthetase [Perkinsela sp. CCAP 1560/4]